MDLKSIEVQGWLDWFATNKHAFEAIEVILGILGILLIAPIIWGIKQFLKMDAFPCANTEGGDTRGNQNR